MNRRLVGVFAFALTVAGFTSFVVYRLLLAHVSTPSAAHGSAAPAPDKLIVAAHDMETGALIKDSDLTERDWSGVIPKQAVRSKSDLVGRGVTSPVYENEPFFEQRLAPKGAGAGMASTIPLGMRAVALRVNDLVSLGGFVLPGMHVDVLAAGDAPGDDTNAGRRCRTVLQNVQVLSVGQHFEKNPEGKPETAEIVNLLVTPDQAETIDLASGDTRVQLVLRNPLDTKEAPTHGTNMAALFGQKIVGVSPKREAEMPPPPTQASAPQKPPPTVEVFNGTHKTDQMITIGGGGK